jgi:F0F1-type ATP synthase delta subunit
MVHEQQPGLVLPPLVVGVADIMRLRRELDALHEYLHQAALRQVSADQLKLPKTSRGLDELALANKINLLNRDEFDRVAVELERIQETAPQVHISFSTDPSSAFVGKIVDWFRQNVHPGLLVQVGIQPTLAAGCLVRTTNKQFDLSLKQHFKAARPTLVQKLHEDTA